MNKKVIILFEILCIFIAVVYYFVKILIPEYHEKLGSSDRFVSVGDYENMIEIVIDQDIDFAVLINSHQEIYHIFFFNTKSTCFYNQNIEKKSFLDASNRIVKKLIEIGYLKSTSSIQIIRFGDNYYKEFFNAFSLSFQTYGFTPSFVESTNSLENKRNQLQLEGDSQNQILRNMDYHSKEFIWNKVKDKNSTKESSYESFLTEEKAQQYTNNVYKKIESYVIDKKVLSMDYMDKRFPITMIPADENGVYYPSNSSWYFVKDGKVSAYIELIDNQKKYGYCYKESMDSVRKGEC